VNAIDFAIYKACLEALKNGTAFNKSLIARVSGVSRQTIYSRIEKYTFQDLDKYRPDTFKLL